MSISPPALPHRRTNAKRQPTPPIIYLIRHGEKPAKLPNGQDANGLSPLGLKRAQYLVSVFGKSSAYNIQYILAEKPLDDGSRARPSETVTPLAESLGLEIDISIPRDDAQGAANAAKSYRGPGNVLVCWEHGQLAKIAEAMGVEGNFVYPGDRFDLIWKVEKPYTRIESTTSEDTPLDRGLPTPANP